MSSIKNIAAQNSKFSAGTDFANDILARTICSSLDDALSGKAPDIIVIGSGMYGSYLAAKLNRLSQRTPKVVVLERGPFITTGHIQNIPAILDAAILEAAGDLPYSASVHIHKTGETREDKVAAHQYCVGGKSVTWGKWSPRMTEDDLTRWPKEVADFLKCNYETVEEELGVSKRVDGKLISSDFVRGPLQDWLLSAVSSAAHEVSAELLTGAAPIAAQSDSPESGLFSFDAFSSLANLTDAIRDDVALHSKPQDRLLHLVPRARVVRLEVSEYRDEKLVSGIHIVEGRDALPRFIPVSSHTKVILALGSMESTKLVFNSKSFSNPMIGRTLMTHFRSNISLRVARESLSGLPSGPLPVGALHLQGSTSEFGGRSFHFQLFASADSTRGGDSIRYRVLPDLDSRRQMVDSLDDKYLSFVVRTVGEDLPDFEDQVGDHGSKAVQSLEQDLNTNLDVPSLAAHWHLSEEDDDFWNYIDETAISVMRLLAGNAAIEFLNPETGEFETEPQAVEKYRDALSATYHEAGTLRMGCLPDHSVVRYDGRFHECSNLYCVDQAIFPYVGSANPVLTGLTLVRRIVLEILSCFGGLKQLCTK